MVSMANRKKHRTTLNVMTKNLINRLQILITGLVQGVGFRPHVYRIAQKLQLTGWVQNTPLGVLIEIQGLNATSFLTTLTGSLPPLAKIDEIQSKTMPFTPLETTFQINASETGPAQTLISPDTSICKDCLRELFDAQSRYYRYPFLNCTHCGPRLTITRALPYDREQTTMAGFPLCADCRKDYLDPSNRRYHAQPTACAECGPTLSMPIKAIATALLKGQIIALKGLGGYQLICDANNEYTILTLRQRKQRVTKPFALMVADCSKAASIVEIPQPAADLLMSTARPIVLLKKINTRLPESIAPGLSHLGIMIPATPFHYLLFNALPDNLVLIVTSANLAGEPLIIEDEEARLKLATIADAIVSYNRPIITRVDDSVLRLINHAPVFIWRARGYVPEPIKLPYAIPSTLATGGHLKNTFCITRQDEAFVSQHIGSLTNKATIEFFHESLAYWIRFLNIKIERIATDLHPDFYTTQWAESYNLPVTPVQHHHAHLASVAAEHHILEPALGLALDGYGYGTGGEAWGGELLQLNQARVQRLSGFLPLPQPGGDLATREPWRMAASILNGLGKSDEIMRRFSNQPQAALLAHLLKTNPSFPLSSSCGRLFDAASALLGINALSHYEGEAASKLESLVTTPTVLPHGWCFDNNQFSLLPTFNEMLQLNPISGANIFHGTLIAGLAEWLLSWSKRTGIKVILLSGGCFLNQVLSEGLYQQLTQHGLQVYLPKRLPANDGGLSLGQAWIAACSN